MNHRGSTAAEREEFRLPEELALLLSQPMSLVLPHAATMARRAIALGEPFRLPRFEQALYALASGVCVLAFGRMLLGWWNSLSFRILIPAPQLTETVNEFALTLSRYNWWAAAAGLALALVFTLFSTRLSKL